MRRTHSQSHAIIQLCGLLINQKCFILTFANCKTHKISRMTTRMRCHAATQLCCHVTTIHLLHLQLKLFPKHKWIQIVTDRHRQMTTTKMYSLYKGGFQGDVLPSGWVSVWNKISRIADWFSKRDNIFRVYIESVSSGHTRHMFITVQ